MRPLPILITCLVLVGMVACTPEAPGTGDTTERVTVADDADARVATPAPDPAQAPTSGALQLVTAGAPQPYLGDSAGRGLYFLEGDTDGSKCTGECLRAWPPFLATEAKPTGAANLQPDLIGVITRADGSTQVTYNRHPLYHYAADTSADHAAGHGIRDRWGQWRGLDAAGQPLAMPAAAPTAGEAATSSPQSPQPQGEPPGR